MIDDLKAVVDGLTAAKRDGEGMLALFMITSLFSLQLYPARVTILIITPLIGRVD